MGSDRGGILSLGATLDAHWDALEADFQRFYGLDLRDELKGSARRLHALIDQLPPGSAFWRDQGWRDPSDLMHEWMVTLIKFQAGEKVHTPPFYSNGKPQGKQKTEAVRVSAGELENVLGGHGIVFG